MFTQFYKRMATILCAAFLVTAKGAPVAAETAPQPATNREGAAAPLADTVAIEPGTVHWYRFKYSYDSSSDKSPSEAIVLLKMNAAECIGFDVETPGTLAAAPQEGKKHEPIGRGSPLTKKVADFDPANATESAEDAEDTNDDGQIDEDENPYYDKEHGVVENEQVLIWVGSARAKETFYVVVKNKSTAACGYTLSITGPTVSFPSSQ